MLDSLLPQGRDCARSCTAESRRQLEAERDDARKKMSDDGEAWLTKLKLCISETVAMRHPDPMEHIAHMLVNPSFHASRDLSTAEYVQRHDLEQRITKALDVAGFAPGQAVPSDMSRLLSEKLLADAKREAHSEVVLAAKPLADAKREAHSDVVLAAVRAAKTKLESAPLPSEGEAGAEQDSSSAWSCRTWAASLPLGELLIKGLCAPVEELVKDWPAHTRSAAELTYVRKLFEGIAHSQDPNTEVATLLR